MDRVQNLLNQLLVQKCQILLCREFLKKLKIRLFISNVGDRYVIEKMKKNKSKLGGEPSGHIIFSENGYCGDGILTSFYDNKHFKK